jgi:hypothetical protein
MSREMVAAVRDHVIANRCLLIYGQTPDQVEVWMDVGGDATMDATCVAILDTTGALILAEDLLKAVAYVQACQGAQGFRPSRPVWETDDDEEEAC